MEFFPSSLLFPNKSPGHIAGKDQTVILLQRVIKGPHPWCLKCLRKGKAQNSLSSHARTPAWMCDHRPRCVYTGTCIYMCAHTHSGDFVAEPQAHALKMEVPSDRRHRRGPGTQPTNLNAFTVLQNVCHANERLSYTTQHLQSPSAEGPSCVSFQRTFLL
jgi:hypothetical protein